MNSLYIPFKICIFFYHRWLDHFENAISNEECYSNDPSWVAYHANKAETNNANRCKQNYDVSFV